MQSDTAMPIAVPTLLEGNRPGVIHDIHPEQPTHDRRYQAEEANDGE